MDIIQRDTDMTPPPAEKPGPAERKAIHAYLSPEAHDIWHNYAEEEGVSVSGLLEVMATDMLALDLESGDGQLSIRNLLPRATKAARKLDAQRRRRGR